MVCKLYSWQRAGRLVRKAFYNNQLFVSQYHLVWGSSDIKLMYQLNQQLVIDSILCGTSRKVKLPDDWGM
jgi:hypothetical protein